MAGEGVPGAMDALRVCPPVNVVNGICLRVLSLA